MPAPDAPFPIVRSSLLLGALVALTIIGSSAVAVALPTLARDLGLDTAGSAWVLATFAITFSLGTAVFGRLADLHGLRAPLHAGLVLLVAGSLLAALSTGFPSLIAGRLLQGAGAGSVPVLVNAIIARGVPPEQRGRALGGMTAMVAIVSGSGPFIGGALTQLVGWRVVLGVPLVALALAWPIDRVVPAHVRVRGRVDVLGVVLVALTVSALTVALQSPAMGYGAAGLLGAGALLLVAGALLARHVVRRPHGFLPRTIVRNAPLMFAAASSATLIGGYMAAMFTLPKILTAELGWSPLQIGLAMLPPAALAAVGSQLSGRVTGRPWSRFVVTGFAIASALGLLVASVGAPTPALLLIGFAPAAVAFAGGQVVMIDTIPRLVAPETLGVAFGTFNLVFFIGGGVGAALVGGLGDALGLAGALGVVALLPASGAVLAVLATPRGP